MGNLPLPSPPQPSSTRAVASIVTRPLVGTLQLIPSADVLVDQLSFLEGRSEQERKSKVAQLEDRITRYRSGRVNLAVIAMALLVVLLFSVGIFFNWFWRVVVFGNPALMISLATIEIVLAFVASYIEKREIAALISDSKTIFEDWWEEPHAVRVTVRRVYGKYPQSNEENGSSQKRRRCCCTLRQGKFISLSFQKEDDAESIGVTRTLCTDTHSVDLHVY